MPDEATTAVQRYADAISRGDVDAALEVCHAEVEFSSLLAKLEGTTYRGHAGVRRYFRDVDAAWDEWRMETEQVLRAPDGRVLIVLRMHVRGRGSRVPLEQSVAHVWELRDGKLWRSTPYRDPEEALRAVGLQAAPGRARGAESGGRVADPD
jgi:ketosteroid isomerase-like protein